jgi:hypothetical protein
LPDISDIWLLFGRFGMFMQSSAEYRQLLLKTELLDVGGTSMKRRRFFSIRWAWQRWLFVG